MLVSLNLVEYFISLPKLNQTIHIFEKPKTYPLYNAPLVASILTGQGFEVEKITYRGQGMESVVVGKIVSVAPHPDAQKLQICQVDVGANELQQIVCGAPNARAGLFVAAALPGCILPGLIEIQPAKIRGIPSFGMLCSRSELGLPCNPSVDGEGIFEIAEDVQGGIHPSILSERIGVPVFFALNLYDIVMDVSVTPNRPDMLSHEGVARELGVGFADKNIAFDYKRTRVGSKNNPEKIKNQVAQCGSLFIGGVAFEAESDLNQPVFFLGMENVVPKPSPAWLRNILEALGQSSINTVVDASNFILQAYGQPSHAFDFEKIAHNPSSGKKQLTLRQAHPQEAFIGIDGKVRQLDGSDAVVADSQNVQALLGILGGELSKVDFGTKHLLVEFANPDSVSVRRTSRRQGRQTDASFRFEKGIDILRRFEAAAKFCDLIQDLHEKPAQAVLAVHGKNRAGQPIFETAIQEQCIHFSPAILPQILGAPILNFSMQLEILKNLGFSFVHSDHNNFQDSGTVLLRVPSWRLQDVQGPHDLVEECIRVVGIDSIPPAPLCQEITAGRDDPHLSFLENLCSHAAVLGYHEVTSFHFMRADDYEKMNLTSINAFSEPVVLLNPIIGDEPLLHNTLIPDLLRKCARNIHYGTKSGQLFHSCRTFQNRNVEGQRVFENDPSLPFAKQLSAAPLNTLREYCYEDGLDYCASGDRLDRPVETPRLSGVLFGRKVQKHWHNLQEELWTLHDVIGHVLSLARRCGLSLEVTRIGTKDDANCPTPFHPAASALHPGRRVGFFLAANHAHAKPKFVGWAGALHPRVARNYEIDVPCYVFELNVALLFKLSLQRTDLMSYKTQAIKLPPISKDFAFIVEENIIWGPVNKSIRSSLDDFLRVRRAHLEAVDVFDIYRGKGVDAGKKSVAFNLSVVPLEKTFTEGDIQELIQIVCRCVELNFHGQLR